MTVRELIERLRSFDETMRVVTPGFDEGGLEDVERVEIRKVRFDVNPRGKHYGPHEASEDGIPSVFVDW